VGKLAIEIQTASKVHSGKANLILETPPDQTHNTSPVTSRHAMRVSYTRSHSHSHPRTSKRDEILTVIAIAQTGFTMLETLRGSTWTGTNALSYPDTFQRYVLCINNRVDNTDQVTRRLCHMSIRPCLSNKRKRSCTPQHHGQILSSRSSLSVGWLG